MGAMKEEVEEKMIKGIVAMKEAIKALEETIIYDNNEDVIKSNKHELSGLIKMIKDDKECEEAGNLC
ncbi:hypothetical protein P5E42_15830, partial [Clostridium perfringens]|nr:hypothetical protein [Clostridium perfringens]